MPVIVTCTRPKVTGVSRNAASTAKSIVTLCPAGPVALPLTSE
jgi:hypothetical protein